MTLGLLQVLIADFFFICVALAWLAAGVAEKGSLNSTVSLSSFPVHEAAVPGDTRSHHWASWVPKPVLWTHLFQHHVHRQPCSMLTRSGRTAVILLQNLLDSWYPLWTLLFQPALGVLMLGAVGCASLHPSVLTTLLLQNCGCCI